MSSTVGVGQFIPWDGGCLFIGSTVATVPVHAHQAIQIVFGSGPEIRLRTSEDAPWVGYEAAVIPSQQPHALDSTTGDYSAVIFVEPETREGRALTERYSRPGIARAEQEALGAARPALFDTWLAHRDGRATVEATWQVITTLTRGVEPSVVVDERILRALAYIQSRIDKPMTLAEVASEAYLSPGRFRHLFAEQTGMGLRPYILWRRLLRALELAMAGESLSTAAHGAGFADSAHLTRTSRRMIGLAPSSLELERRPR